MRTLVCLGITLLCLPCRAAEVGLYFDEAATRSSCPDGLLTRQDLFLVLAGGGDGVIVSGWKAVIEHGSSTFCMATELLGGGTNRGQHPRYEVELTEPLRGSSLVLAKFCVIALEPDLLSIDIDVVLRLPEGSDPAVAGGGVIVHGPVSIGIDTESTRRRSVREIEVPGLRPLDENGVTFISENPQFDPVMSLHGFEHLLYMADFCVVGSLVDLDLRCGGQEFNWGGIGVADLDIRKSYWDEGAPVTYVCLPASHVEGCARVIHPLAFEGYRIGETYLILGKMHHGVPVAEEMGVFRYDDGEFVRPPGLDMEFVSPEALAEEYSRRHDYRRQFDEADVVALVSASRRIEDADDHLHYSHVVVPKVLFKGAVATDSLLISYRREEYTGWLSHTLPPHLIPGREYLQFLEVSQDDRLMPLYGTLSSLEIEPGSTAQ